MFLFIYLFGYRKEIYEFHTSSYGNQNSSITKFFKCNLFQKVKGWQRPIEPTTHSSNGDFRNMVITHKDRWSRLFFYRSKVIISLYKTSYIKYVNALWVSLYFGCKIWIQMQCNQLSLYVHVPKSSRTYQFEE